MERPSANTSGDEKTSSPAATAIPTSLGPSTSPEGPGRPPFRYFRGLHRRRVGCVKSWRPERETIAESDLAQVTFPPAPLTLRVTGQWCVIPPPQQSKFTVVLSLPGYVLRQVLTAGCVAWNPDAYQERRPVGRNAPAATEGASSTSAEISSRTSGLSSGCGKRAPVAASASLPV